VIDENPEIADALEKRMHAHIAKREVAMGITNPMYTNLDWYGHGGGPFKSHDEAYNTIYIGDLIVAKELQEPNK